MDASCIHDTYDANVIEFKQACYARCNCWTNLPSLGGMLLSKAKIQAKPNKVWV